MEHLFWNSGIWNRLGVLGLGFKCVGRMRGESFGFQISGIEKGEADLAPEGLGEEDRMVAHVWQQQEPAFAFRGLRVSGRRFRVDGFGLQIPNFDSRDLVTGHGVQGFRISGFGLAISGIPKISGLSEISGL